MSAHSRLAAGGSRADTAVLQVANSPSELGGLASLLFEGSPCLQALCAVTAIIVAVPTHFVYVCACVCTCVGVHACVGVYGHI